MSGRRRGRPCGPAAGGLRRYQVTRPRRPPAPGTRLAGGRRPSRASPQVWPWPGPVDDELSAAGSRRAAPRATRAALGRMGRGLARSAWARATRPLQAARAVHTRGEARQHHIKHGAPGTQETDSREMFGWPVVMRERGAPRAAAQQHARGGCAEESTVHRGGRREAAPGLQWGPALGLLLPQTWDRARRPAGAHALRLGLAQRVSMRPVPFWASSCLGGGAPCFDAGPGLFVAWRLLTLLTWLPRAPRRPHRPPIPLTRCWQRQAHAAAHA